MIFLKRNHKFNKKNKSQRKKVTTGFLFLLLCTSVISQTTKIDSMLVDIDKTNFTTNILYERTTPWSRLDIFNDSINISTKSHFEQALHELYKASNEQKFVYYRDLRNLYIPKSNRNTVDIGIINASFNELNYVESDENISALHIVDDKFEKNDNNIPIFKEKKVLVISPLKEKLIGNAITYKFNNQFTFQETDLPIQTLIVNFDTQQDYTIIENGAITTNSITINYSQKGIKTLTFYATFTDGSTLTTNSALKLALPITPPPMVITDTIPATINFQGALGEVEYRIFYRTKKENGSTNYQAILKKPVIIIDGFDPGDERKIGFLDDDENDNTLINQMYYQDNDDVRQNLVTKLREEAYDVVIVNQITHTKNNVEIDGGADYIERNAMAHVALYQHLNSILTQNNSTEELVVMGPSMGGQISRYALAYMEKENIPHNTRLWVSIDSPHLGANIPLGMQAMMNLLDAFGDSVAAADFYNDRLKSVAGNQQLIEQHLPYHLPDHLNNGSPVRQQYMSNLTSNGLQGSNGYPQNLRKIAIVNGSLMGINVDVAGTEDFRIHGFANSIFGDIKVVEMNTKYMPNTGQTKQIARFWRRLKPKRTATFTNNNPNGSMDIVPGGLFDTEGQLHRSVMNNNPDIFSLNNGISLGNALLAGLGWGLLGISGDSFESRTNKEIHSFVPTISALGFTNPNFNWSENLNRNLVCTNEIPFDTYFGPRNNEPHTSFTEESKNWLFEELAGNEQLPTVYLEANDLNGPDIVCSNDIVTYDFGNCKLGASVEDWEVSSNLQVINSDSVSITVQGASTSNNGYVKAIFPDYTLQKDIWVGTPKTPSFLNGPEIVLTGAIVTYSGGVAEGATSYKWWLPTPYDVVSPMDYWSDNWQTYPNMGRNNSHVFTGYAGNNGLVQLTGVNSCGDGGAKMINVEHGNGGGGNQQNPVVPYPNSSDTDFKLDFSTYPEGTYHIFIYDMYSNIMYQGQSSNVEKTIYTLDIPNGIYYLHVHDGDEVTMQQLIIEH